VALVRLEVVGTTEWFTAVAAGIVPTTKEAEDFLRAIEDELSPKLRLVADAIPKPYVTEVAVLSKFKEIGTVSGVAEEFGVSRATVRDRLRKAGVR
jgi:DNA invertase Pin-like site-specific DNA recombinase